MAAGGALEGPRRPPKIGIGQFPVLPQFLAFSRPKSSAPLGQKKRVPTAPQVGIFAPWRAGAALGPPWCLGNGHCHASGAFSGPS